MARIISTHGCTQRNLGPWYVHVCQQPLIRLIYGSMGYTDILTIGFTLLCSAASLTIDLHATLDSIRRHQERVHKPNILPLPSNTCCWLERIRDHS